MSAATREWRAADAAALLRVPRPDSHKYSRGVLGLRTGSHAYPGAAVLTAEAAWRTGVGLVRYISPHEQQPPAFGLPSPAAAILTARPETVFSGDEAADRARCDAWLIGSGTDPAMRVFAEQEALKQLLAGDAPVVVDAGALDLVASRPAAPVVITPHLGEFRELWRLSGLGSEAAERLEPSTAAATLARELDVTVLLKGSRTVIASPAGGTLVTGPATPWLATAGTGDVLAGVLGALVATHAREVRKDTGLITELSATAALLHDAAARIASCDEDPTVAAPTADPQCRSTGHRIAGHPITALDVAEALPQAFAWLSG